MRNFQKNIDRIISKLNECVEELKQCNEEMQKVLEGENKNGNKKN